jgi:hypothetical protein
MTSTREIITQVTSLIDEALLMTAGHQIVSASEMTDKLLDVRILLLQFAEENNEEEAVSSDC